MRGNWHGPLYSEVELVSGSEDLHFSLVVRQVSGGSAAYGEYHISRL